ncbi:MAG TPA: HDOD domain-containing protein [Candidatus Saccharimonadales bacterium]|nr:HDOD domain-containing protein [Candidatus Saccharimonadales bacterium]
MPTIRVLVVDDAVVMRRMIAEALARDPQFEVAGTAANGRVALQKIPQLNPDLVTLDVEMPEMDGLATLREVRQAYPDLPVIMLGSPAAKGDGKAREVRALGAADYVMKPVNTGSFNEGLERLEQELLPKIKAHCRHLPAQELSDAQTPSSSCSPRKRLLLDVEDLIEQAQDLTPLPPSAVRLATVATSGDVSLDEVAEVVSYDEVLTMKLLRAANSVVLGGATRCTEAREAVLRLGTARILVLTVAAGARSLLRRNVYAYGLAEGRLWKHSIAAATAAEVLSEFTDRELPTETFTAALLHDVGKLVMGRFLSTEDLEWIRRAQKSGGLSPLAAEVEILNLHHGELGGIIAQHWQMGPRIVEGIHFHHNPHDGSELICHAVYLSNIVAKHLEGLNAPPTPDPASLECLGVGAGRMNELLAAARSRFESISIRYNAV